MFLRKDPDERLLAAMNAPLRSAAVVGKCLAILALSSALVVVIGGNSHVFGRPLIALLLTAIIVAVLVSLRPRLFLAPLGAAERLDERSAPQTINVDPLFLMSPSPGLLVDCESREILAANQAAADLYGYALGDLGQLSLAALLPVAATPDVAQGDLPAAGLARHQRADGSTFWGELQFSRIERPARAAWLVTVTDVSTRMNLARDLENSERFAADLIELSLGIVFIHDLNGDLRTVNPAFAQALGYAAEELAGRNLGEFQLPRQHGAFGGYLSSIDQDGVSNGVIRLRTRDGGERVWEYRNRLRLGSDGGKSILCCAIDISERARNERRLLETRNKDPLTGCYTRQHLQVFEEDAEPVACWAAIVVEIDHFQRYSESQDHRAGEQAIIGTARMLESMVRSDDSLVRLGADEFVILLRRCDQATLESFAGRLQRLRDNHAGVPFTFGLAMRKDGEALAETIHRADRQLIERRVIERSSIRLGNPRETRLLAQRRLPGARLPDIAAADGQTLVLRDAGSSA